MTLSYTVIARQSGDGRRGKISTFLIGKHWTSKARATSAKRDVCSTKCMLLAKEMLMTCQNCRRKEYGVLKTIRRGLQYCTSPITVHAQYPQYCILYCSSPPSHQSIDWSIKSITTTRDTKLLLYYKYKRNEREERERLKKKKKWVGSIVPIYVSFYV